ncbi:MAG: HAD family phosphatase [Lachnospiraceae bacterium]|nr:HAD family phosphatase [Lachnospiraceae bacterium]
MNSTKDRAVVFDMDGVLFDTERLCMDMWAKVADARGLSGMIQVGYDSIGRNENDTRALTLAAFGADFDFEDFRAEVARLCHNYMQQQGIPVKKGVQELLDFLQEQGYRIALASSSSRQSVLRNLERAGFTAYFEEIISGDMVEHSKPRPDIYLLACEKLGVEPKAAYAIEDSPNGIRAAHGAGMKPIMVPDLIEADEEMKILSQVILDDLSAVRDYLAANR